MKRILLDCLVTVAHGERHGIVASELFSKDAPGCLDNEAFFCDRVLALKEEFFQSLDERTQIKDALNGDGTG